MAKQDQGLSPAGNPPEDLGNLSQFQVAGDDFNVRSRHKPKGLGEVGGLTVTSLMDILTIILVFLLKSYSANPVNVTMSSVLKIPESTAHMMAEQAVPVAITQTNILVDDKPVADVSDGEVDASTKRDGAKGYFITPLFDALSKQADKQKRIAKANSSQQFKGLALIIADKDTPYRLLNEVLYTAGQAQFGQFKFVVVAENGM